MKVTERLQQKPGEPVFICDFSPPRGGGSGYLEQARGLDTDFICVAYNPGRAVRIDSAAMAHTINTNAGKDVAFNLSPRDMNKLAIQSHLLGAQALGLENVVVLAGDPLSERDWSLMSPVNDFKATELIEAIAVMNQGSDFRGTHLREPTDFCVGAALDLSGDVEQEALLAYLKVQAGAQFFITQPIFNPAEAARFHQAYQANADADLQQPVFWGVQVLEQGAVMFSGVPQGTREELDGGRSGVDIALEILSKLGDAGIHTFYLVPPILRGGARNYEAAQEVLAEVSRRTASRL